MHAYTGPFFMHVEGKVSRVSDIGFDVLMREIIPLVGTILLCGHCLDCSLK
jgi:hypothetical protein